MPIEHAATPTTRKSLGDGPCDGLAKYRDRVLHIARRSAGVRMDKISGTENLGPALFLGIIAGRRWVGR